VHKRALPWPVGVLLALVFGAILVRTAWISDDAAITLRTVLNVTHGFGLTYNISERVQTFTHPLWALWLTAVYLVVGNIYTAAFVASIAMSIVAFWLALSRAASAWQAAMAAVVLLFSRAFIDYSTSGLENPLTCVLLAATAIAWIRLEDRPGRRLTVLALLASLLYLTRPDAVLLVAPLVLVACWRVRLRQVARAIAIGALPAIGWTLFAIVYYGFPFPNTAYAKLGMDIPRAELWRQGWLYLIDSLDRDPLTLVTIAFAALVGLRQRAMVTRAWALGVALYLVYIVSIGGDFMAGRFLAAPLFASVLFLGLWMSAPKPIFGVFAAVALVMGVVSPHVPLASDAHFDDAAMRPTGIVDERGVYFKDRSLVRATRATLDEPDWPTSRVTLPAQRNVIRTCGLMGSAGLEFGPATHLLDECALADPLLARLPAVFNSTWRTGHYRRMVPVGYEESLAHGMNALQDPNLRAYYDDLRAITRGPIWSTARWHAIARVNLGKDDRFIDVAFYRHEGALAPVASFAADTPDGAVAGADHVRALPAALAISCDDRPGRRYLDVKLDSAEAYRLYFLQREAIVSVLDLSAIPAYRRQPGLASFTIDLPARATEQGFDTIVVAPLAPSPRAAIGQLLLDGVPATQAELDRRIAQRDAR
jgi:arabinofuranosyltransferase